MTRGGVTRLGDDRGRQGAQEKRAMGALGEMETMGGGDECANACEYSFCNRFAAECGEGQSSNDGGMAPMVGWWGECILSNEGICGSRD